MRPIEDQNYQHNFKLKKKIFSSSVALIIELTDLSNFQNAEAFSVVSKDYNELLNVCGELSVV